MSLRARLLIALLIAVLVGVAIVDGLTYVLVVRSQLDQVDQDLERAHPPIERAAAAPEVIREAAIREAAPGFLVELRSPEGDPELTLPLPRPGDEPLTLTGDVPPPSGASNDNEPDDETIFATVASSGEHPLRVRVSRQPDEEILVIGRSLESMENTRHQLFAVLIVATLGALAVAGVIGLVLVRVGLRPLVAVQRAAGQISDTDIDRRVPGENDRTEVGRLAVAINRMLARLQAAFAQRTEDIAALQESQARMRRFVADASHELRTPVAATSAYAELFERGARDHPDDLARSMSGIRAETARMGALVEDLLLLAQLDEGRPIELGPVDLTDVVVEAVDAARLLAPDHPTTIRVDAAPVVTGDASRLRQVFDNLLGNVRTHTPPGTTCEIVVGADDEGGVVTVADDGPGMPADDARRAFDRFHRADASRTRASGGTGLGLAIVDAIVAAHGGSVAMRSDVGAGTRVTVHLPFDATSEAT
jgi:signal transduction histidine kinase